MSKIKYLKYCLGFAGGALKASFQTAAAKVKPESMLSIDDKIIKVFKDLDATKQAKYKEVPELIARDDNASTYWRFEGVLMDQLSLKGWPTILSSSWDDNNPPPESERFLHTEISNALCDIMRYTPYEVSMRHQLAHLKQENSTASQLIFDKFTDLAEANETLKAFGREDILKTRTYKMLGAYGPMPI